MAREDGYYWVRWGDSKGATEDWMVAEWSSSRWWLTASEADFRDENNLFIVGGRIDPPVGASPPVDGIDYKALLKKYITHVSIQEGIHFIEEWDDYEYRYTESGIAKEEAAELLRVANEKS